MSSKSAAPDKTGIADLYYLLLLNSFFDHHD